MNHVLVYYADQLRTLVNGKSVGDLMIILAYLNAVLLTQLPMEDVKEYAKMTHEFGSIYPDILKASATQPTAKQLALVIPAAEGYDYSPVPKIFDYISREEMDEDGQEQADAEKADLMEQLWKSDTLKMPKTIQ